MVTANDRCPVGSERIDEYAARVNGALVVVLLALSLAPGFQWVFFYLLADFAIKVFAGFAYSPNCRVAKLIAQGLHLPVRPIPAAPKRFAAVIGLMFLAGAMAAWYGFGSFAGLAGFVGALGVCAALESFGGFCIGCRVYAMLPEAVAQPFIR